MRHWTDFGETELWGTYQVAQYLRKSQSTVRQYIKRGWLVPDDVKSGRYKFRKSTVIAFEHKLWECYEKGDSVFRVSDGCTK